MDTKAEKLRMLLKETGADFLQQHSNGTSLITVTDCSLSHSLRKAIIFLSVFPESREQEALNFAKRKRQDFRNFVQSNTRLRYVPFFDFAIDEGEKNRQRIEILLQEDKEKLQT